MAETVKTHSDTTTSAEQSVLTSKEGNTCEEDSTADVSMCDETSLDTPNTEIDTSGKKELTEEERLKRKEFFKELREAKKLAKDKTHQSFAGQISKNRRNGGKNSLQQKLSVEENKMLEFYKARLSTLRTENELLHKTLCNLVQDNLKLLQKGPPKTFY